MQMLLTTVQVPAHVDEAFTGRTGILASIGHFHDQAKEYGVVLKKTLIADVQTVAKCRDQLAAARLRTLRMQCPVKDMI